MKRIFATEFNETIATLRLVPIYLIATVMNRSDLIKGCFHGEKKNLPTNRETRACYSFKLKEERGKGKGIRGSKSECFEIMERLRLQIYFTA